MRVVNTHYLTGTPRQVDCPNGGFTSYRAVIAEDGMGFSMHETVIPKGPPQVWHYKHHKEACYCLAGRGTLTDLETGEQYDIKPGCVYSLDKNDRHSFEAIETVHLVSVFNPPVVGQEVHGADGSYPPPPRELSTNGHKSPVYDVRAVPIDKVQANDYNPNAVAPPEMELLETSIWEDGYTQPVVTYYDQDTDTYIVVDGFHRFLILRDSKRIREREGEMLPVVVIDKDLSDRMASTIRHNRARGSHNVELMSTIVAELVEMGKGDRWICKHIGMSADELLRLKQITGLASLFANRDFSDSWEADMSAFSDEEQFEDAVE